MSEHNLEEQEMEMEALTAIFDTAFEPLTETPPFHWSVKLVPVDTGGDEEEYEKQNHVIVKLLAKLPSTYPEEEGPDLDIEVVKGLAEDQRMEILKLAQEEAEANAGMPVIFAVCEAVRTWLADNNVKGQDDGSMYAQMMRKAKDDERKKAQAELQFEAQKQVEEMTQAELEEQAVRKKREEGTPCTAENFYEWKAKFEAEMEEQKKKARELAEKESNSSKKKEKLQALKLAEETAGRLTGFQQFSGKAINLEAIEAAAEQTGGGDGDEDADGLVENLDEVDEDLFDDDDDLDDLDFDSDEEEDEPDI